MGRALSDDARRALLHDVQRMPPDADLIWDSADVLRRFVPLPLHDRIFDPQVMIIRGARGAGKSMLFHVLRALGEQRIPITDLFPRARVADPVWIEGFAETGMRHPATHLVEAFVKSASDVELRSFWTLHLALCVIHRFAPEDFDRRSKDSRNVRWLEEPNYIRDWLMPDARGETRFVTALDIIERQWTKLQQRPIFVTYDHLDKIGLHDAEVRARATSSLLSLWLSLGNRYRMLRPKIFLREDLFERSAHQSADASKLRGRSISLTWDTQALYRMLVRHMAAESPALAEWLQRGKHGVPLTEHAIFGRMPPEHLPEDGAVSQRKLVERIVGPHMGKGPTAGIPYRWIPGRLQDAHKVVVPRSVLTLFSIAAEKALANGPQATSTRLLHPDELRGAIEGTSRQHVNQTAEEHLVVMRLENLRGRVLLLDRDETVAALARPRPNVRDGFGDDGEWVLDELLRIGIVRRRHDGRLDVPDIYRFAFGIKRRGGVPRPR